MNSIPYSSILIIYSKNTIRYRSISTLWIISGTLLFHHLYDKTYVIVILVACLVIKLHLVKIFKPGFLVLNCDNFTSSKFGWSNPETLIHGISRLAEHQICRIKGF